MVDINTVSSEFQTKEWRQENICKTDGQKDSSSEKYQRRLVVEITHSECPKSNVRINKRTLEFKDKTQPMTEDDGFDWTEDFDGKQEINNTILMYNFKFVAESGGGQTRTLRDETYSFIEIQLKYLKKNQETNIKFINLLDGAESYKRMKHFNYLINLEEYKEYKSKCLVMDTHTFKSWYLTNN